jgi:hypothetical protein
MNYVIFGSFEMLSVSTNPFKVLILFFDLRLTHYLDLSKTATSFRGAHVVTHPYILDERKN